MIGYPIPEGLLDMWQQAQQGMLGYVMPKTPQNAYAQGLLGMALMPSGVDTSNVYATPQNMLRSLSQQPEYALMQEWEKAMPTELYKAIDKIMRSAK